MSRGSNINGGPDHANGPGPQQVTVTGQPLNLPDSHWWTRL